MSKTRNSSSRINPAAHILPWLYGLILVFPLYYLVVSDFKDNTAIFNHPFALPTSLSFDQFTQAWNNVQLGSGLANSTLVTVSAEILTLALAIPASFALARAKGKIGVWVERFFTAGFLVPAFAALVPTVLLAVHLDLYQTRTFVILLLPATAMPLSVILLTQFMRTVPPELQESASIDGANLWTILTRVYAPLIVPGIVTVAILNFLSFWNEYLFSLILIGPDPSIRTVQVALPNLISQTNTQYGVLLAGALITMIPVYIVYIVLQRRVEDAMLQGAVKT